MYFAMVIALPQFQDIKEFKKLRRTLRREVLCDYSMLVTLYKIGEEHFRLFGTNGFRVKAENVRFTAAG